MLDSLYIKNFALIDELEIDFSAGFSVITGETGAGKSIILGALGLLLGNRADSKAVREGAQKCTIEGHFNISRYNMEPFFTENDIDYEPTDCILRRDVSANGKSRAFINDTPVSLAQMKELGMQLIDIHSQHQNLLLETDQFQLSVVDIIAGSQSLLSEYRDAYTTLHNAERKLKQTEEEIEREKANTDFLRYQFEELDHLHLAEGEEEELAEQSNTMQHAEDIKMAFEQAIGNLDEDTAGILSRLGRTESALSSISNVYGKATYLQQRISECRIELKDILSDLQQQTYNIEYDPDELERINSRLDAIYALQKKHHVSSVGELIALHSEFSTKLNAVENSEVVLDDLRKAVTKAQQVAEKLAKQLSNKRQKAAPLIEKQLLQHLTLLGLPNVRFQVSVSEKPLQADGADEVDFLFSANPGTPLRPVADIASGGEIARVMLSLKALISSSVKLPTIIFDEIDTGVSGKVAEQMAAIMHQMGQAERQVISITHLPQIAAMGQHHYKVQKQQSSTSTTTTMLQLTPQERVEEIAQMLSGSTISEAALQNARTLLNQNN